MSSCHLAPSPSFISEGQLNYVHAVSPTLPYKLNCCCCFCCCCFCGGGGGGCYSIAMWDIMSGVQPHVPNSGLAEKFNKSMREVELRQRFLERQCKDAQGYPITPKLLTVDFQPSWHVAYSMWQAALRDNNIGAVSLGYMSTYLCHGLFKCSRHKDPVIRDMKKFLRTRVQKVRDSSNIHDLPELERTFLAENMTLDDAIAKMRVFCINSGRHDANTMERLYGRPGEEKLVAEKCEWHSPQVLFAPSIYLTPRPKLTGPQI